MLFSIDKTEQAQGEGGIMLDKLKNIYEAQKRMNQMKKDLEQVVVSNEAAGGKVAVTMNGTQKVLSVTIDPSLLVDTQKSFLEKEIVRCLNQAAEKTQRVAAEKLRENMGDLNIPGMP